MTKRSSAALSVIILFAACSPLTESDDKPLKMVTDHQVYTATQVGGPIPFRSYSFRAIVKTTNRGDEEIYLARCSPQSREPIYGVEHLEPIDEWGSAYNPAWACVGHDNQFELQPGDTRTDTILLTGPNAANGITKEPYGRLDGIMRISYEVQGCRGDGACQGGRVHSNPFRVRLEQK